MLVAKITVFAGLVPAVLFSICIKHANAFTGLSESNYSAASYQSFLHIANTSFSSDWRYETGEGRIINIDNAEFPLLKKRLAESIYQETGVIVELNKEPLFFVNEKLSKGVSKEVAEYYLALPSSAPTTKEIALVNHGLALQKEQAEAEQKIKQLLPGAVIKKHYLKAFNGFYLQNIDAEGIKKLKENKFKLYISGERKANDDDVSIFVPDTSTTHKFSGAVSLAHLSTGINYTASAFGRCEKISSACIVNGGFDLVNNDFNPLDDNGLGTQSAEKTLLKGSVYGIRAANISSYKIFDALGYTDDSLILSALERVLDPNIDGIFDDALKVVHITASLPRSAASLFLPIFTKLTNYGITLSMPAVSVENIKNPAQTAEANEGYGISFPQNYDVLRGGVKFGLTVLSPLGSLVSLSFGEGPNPSSWSTLSNKIWDASNLKNGAYTLKSLITEKGAVNEKKSSVFLSSLLREGFPKRVSYDKNEEGEFLYLGGLSPKVGDIDGDGNKEIVLIKQGMESRVFAYKNDGSLLFQAPLGLSKTRILSEPLLIDIDGNDTDEILVVSPKESKLIALTKNGQPHPSFSPPVLPNKNASSYALLSRDMNSDNSPEIIAVPHDANRGSQPIIIPIYSSYGREIGRLNLPKSSPLAPVQAVLGNFDEDAELEIAVTLLKTSVISNGVTAANSSEVYIYNKDGTLAGKNFPITLPGIIFAKPASGDIDGDGLDDLVISVSYLSDKYPDSRFGGLYALNNEGTLLKGFPLKNGHSFITSPVIFDAEDDGFPEIAVSEESGQVLVIDKNGRALPGFPIKTPLSDTGGIVIGDLDQNGAKDIAVTASNVYKDGGGVYAWSVRGELIKGFPLPIEASIGSTPLITDLDNNSLADLIVVSSLDYNPLNNEPKFRGSVYAFELNREQERMLGKAACPGASNGQSIETDYGSILSCEPTNNSSYLASLVSVLSRLFSSIFQ